MSDDPPQSDLSLVATDDLIAELMARHDALLIVRECKPDGTTTETYFDYDGGLSTAIGMATRAQHRLVVAADEEHDDAD